VAGMLKKKILQVASAGVLAAAFLAIGPGQALGAVYPNGGSTFTGDAEGWKVSGACTLPANLPLLCTGDGKYDDTTGNPAGSLAATTEILVNAGGVFKTTFAAESPPFKVGDGGAGAVRLSRALDSGGVAALNPQTTYLVSLLDKTTGIESSALEETISGASPFSGKEDSVTLNAGDTYVIKIAATTETTTAGVGLTGTIATRFDNVRIVGPGVNPGGGNGGALTNSELRSILQSSLVGPAVLIHGKRVLAKAKCPARVGRACSITLTGMLSKRKPATARRVGKVAKGKKRPLLLRVKPRAKARVMKANRLLFKETVRVGSAHATVYKRLRLIKRG
jgi:hypothetical protein